MTNQTELKRMDYKFSIEDLKTIVNLDIVKVVHKMPNSLIYTYMQDNKEVEHRANYFEMLHMFRKKNSYPSLAVSTNQDRIVILEDEQNKIEVTKEAFDFITLIGQGEIIELEAWNRKYKITIEEL